MSEQAAATVPAAARSGRRFDRWFFISVALIMIFFNIVAFGPSLLNPTGRLGPVKILVAGC